MSVEHNKLSNVSTFDVNRIVFSKVQKKIVNNISYSSINIKVKNVKNGSKDLDGTIGDLVFATTEVWSPGVQENKYAAGTWSMPLFLFGLNGATEDEKTFLDTFNSVVEYAKNHIVSVKNEIGRPKLSTDSESFDKFNPLWFKRNKDTNEIAENSSPVFYVKLMQNKKTGQVLSRFVDVNSRKIISFEEMQNKKCYAKAAIKFESIFINAKTISLQIKLVDASVRTKSNIQYYETSNALESDDSKDEDILSEDFNQSASIDNKQTEKSDDEDSGSVVDSDEEQEPEKELPPIDVKPKRGRKTKN